ncbi:MAG: hypothetical protein NC209_08010 [Alistipes sp.]|nr:hypothetical protein [Alistipes senegalensis]MCM1251066.1 hypothetical protein [Alistipes sp.]
MNDYEREQQKSEHGYLALREVRDYCKSSLERPRGQIFRIQARNGQNFRQHDFEELFEPQPLFLFPEHEVDV